MSVEGTGSALQLPGFKSQFQVSSCVMSSVQSALAVWTSVSLLYAVMLIVLHSRDVLVVKLVNVKLSAHAKNLSALPMCSCYSHITN